MIEIPFRIFMTGKSHIRVHCSIHKDDFKNVSHFSIEEFLYVFPICFFSRQIKYLIIISNFSSIKYNTDSHKKKNRIQVFFGEPKALLISVASHETTA